MLELLRAGLAGYGRVFGDAPFLRFCLGTLCVALCYMQSMVTFPLYLEARGFSPSDYGWIMAMNGVLIVGLQLPMTAWIGRFDPLRLLVIAALLVGAGFGMKAFMVTSAQFMLAVVFWTLGEIIQVPQASTVVANLAPPTLRARYMGVFGMSFSGGNFVGAPIGAAVLANLGGGTLWFACAGAALLASMLFLSVPRRRSRPGDPSSKAGAAPDGAASAQA